MLDKNLIIIASQPRSGSTLLQALLSNNKSVGTVSEPWLLLPFLGYNKKDLHSSQYNAHLAAKGIEQFKSKIGKIEFEDDLSRFLLAQYKKVLKQNENYVLDKTPRYYEILEEIVQFFPNCKIIILKRHPFSVFKSIIKTFEVSDINKLLEFKRDVLVAPQMLHAFSTKNELNPNVYNLRYEDLVMNPKDQMKSLYNWIGLEFTEDILNYSKNDKYKGKLGDPKGIEKSDKPNQESVDNWSTLQDDPYWWQFLSGYLKYLTPQFLKDFGDYESEDTIKENKSLKFDIFYRMAQWPFEEHQAKKFTLIKYSILRKLRLF